MIHDHSHDHPLDHNHAHHDHLHSHTHGNSSGEKREELKVLATSFISSFKTADDKTSYLRLSNIPFSKEGSDGLAMHLVDVNITSNWQIGTASPAFGSKELVYMPFPGEMISEREMMVFTYVSLTERSDVDLLEILKNKPEL